MRKAPRPEGAARFARRFRPSAQAPAPARSRAPLLPSGICGSLRRPSGVVLGAGLPPPGASERRPLAGMPRARLAGRSPRAGPPHVPGPSRSPALRPRAGGGSGISGALGGPRERRGPLGAPREGRPPPSQAPPSEQASRAWTAGLPEGSRGSSALPLRARVHAGSCPNRREGALRLGASAREPPLPGVLNCRLPGALPLSLLSLRGAEKAELADRLVLQKCFWRQTVISSLGLVSLFSRSFPPSDQKGRSTRRRSVATAQPHPRSKGFFFKKKMAPLPGNESLNENSDPFLLPSTSVSSLIIFSITFLLGFSGNSLVIWVIVLKMKQTVNTVWFLHLAIADLVCCLSLPFSIVHLALHEYWPFGWFFCKIIPSAIILNMFASVFLLTTISIDRCLLVMKPVWCQNHRTVRFATMICSGIWILAFIMCCPAFFYRETLEDEFANIKCVNNWNMGKHDEYEWLDDLLAIEMMPTEHPTLAADGIYEGIFTSGILDPRPAYAIVNTTKRNTAVPLGISHHHGIKTEIDLLMTVVTHPPSSLYKFPRIHLSTPTASIFQLDNQSASNHTMEMNFHDDFPKTQLPSVLVSITITRTVFGFLLPLAVMATCYTLIGQKMLKKRLVGPRRKAMQVILLVVATFFLCWAPYHLSGVLFLLAPPQTPFHQALLLWDSVFIALAYANSCINPLLYVFVGQNFREKVRQTVQEIFEGAFREPSSPVCSQDRSKTTTVDHDMETSVL